MNRRYSSKSDLSRLKLSKYENSKSNITTNTINKSKVKISKIDTDWDNYL